MNRLLAVLPLLLACDPAVTRQYMGEPIGMLRGKITSSFPDAPPPAEVILAWINWHSEPGTVVGTRVPVEGTFPAGFTMTLHHPPPELALNSLPSERGNPDSTEARVGFAWILVLRTGATPPDQNVIAHADIKSLSPGSVLGWAEDHIFAYVDRDVPEGSWAEEILSGPAARGFHLMRAIGRGGSDLEEIRVCKAEGRTSSECVPMIDPLAPEESDTEVPIRLTPDLSTLRLPVFALPEGVEEAFGIAGGGP